jgi:hypothetical protein
MRKAFLAVLFGAALALALAPAAQAADPGKYLGAADFNFRGQYWMWGTSQSNVADYDDDVHDARRHVYQRFRLYFDTSYEGKYGGTIGLEWNWRWGSDQGSLARPAVGAVQGPGGGPDGDDLVDITRLKHAYVWFMVPNTPAKLTVGLGVQPGIEPQNIMFASNDYFGVRLDVPIIKGVVNASAFWLKDSMGVDPGLVVGFGVPPGDNNPDDQSDDSDMYGIHITAALAKWLTLGTYHVWGHQGEGGAQTLETNSSAFNMLGGRGASFANQNGDLWWHGLYFMAKPGMFFFNGHINYMRGDNMGPGFFDPDPSGAFAYFLQAGIQTGPFKVSARGWWFDGQETFGDEDVDRWMGPDPFFASTELFYSGYKSWGTGVTGYEGAPGGTAFLGIEAEWQVTKQLMLELLAGHLWWTNDSDKPVLTRPFSDKEIGWEIDLAATYKIYPNLSLILGFNYLFAGDGLDHQRRTGALGGFTPEGAATVGVDGVRHGADDAYEFFWRLLYTF